MEQAVRTAWPGKPMPARLLQEEMLELLDRREFLALLFLTLCASAARADDGDSGGDSDSDSGGDSGSDSGGDDGGGDDGGESESENSGSSNSDDGSNGQHNNGQRKDWDRARNALKRGEVIPLKQALKIVATRSKARVIDVSLRQSLFSKTYSFKLKDASGRISTLRMDARTGRIFGK